MIIHVLNGPMAPNEGAAVAQAIAMAHNSFGRIAEKMHIHVVSVVEIDHMFQAIVKVELEPALKKDEEEKPEKKDEPEKKPEEILGQETGPEASEDREEGPAAESKPLDNLHPAIHYAAHHYSPFEPSPLEKELDRLIHAEFDTAVTPTTHIYMLEEMAPRYYDPQYYIDHPDYTFHFIGHGSLWEAAQNISPDMDLYESTHPEVARLMEAEKHYQAELRNDIEQRRALEKRKRLVEDLTDDL